MQPWLKGLHLFTTFLLVFMAAQQVARLLFLAVSGCAQRCGLLTRQKDPGPRQILPVWQDMQFPRSFWLPKPHTVEPGNGVKPLPLDVCHSQNFKPHRNAQKCGLRSPASKRAMERIQASCDTCDPANWNSRCSWTIFKVSHGTSSRPTFVVAMGEQDLVNSENPCQYLFHLFCGEPVGPFGVAAPVTPCIGVLLHHSESFAFSITLKQAHSDAKTSPAERQAHSCCTCHGSSFASYQIWNDKWWREIAAGPDDLGHFPPFSPTSCTPKLASSQRNSNGIRNYKSEVENSLTYGLLSTGLFPELSPDLPAEGVSSCFVQRQER